MVSSAKARAMTSVDMEKKFIPAGKQGLQSPPLRPVPSSRGMFCGGLGGNRTPGAAPGPQANLKRAPKN